MSQDKQKAEFENAGQEKQGTSSQRNRRGTPQRQRLLKILDRLYVLLVGCSVVYWMYLRIGWIPLVDDSSERLPKLAVQLSTIALLGASIALHLTSASEWRRAAIRVFVLLIATAWLTMFYVSSGPHLPFMTTEPRRVHQLCSGMTVGFVLAGMLVHLTNLLAESHRIRSCVTYGLGFAMVVFISIDIAASIAPGVGIIQVGDRVFLKQYHPIFTYRKDETYVMQHPREARVRDFRETMFSQRKPEGVKRIILNGASTVWGHSLEASDCLRTQLEQGLRGEYPDTKWEVLCIAHPGKFQSNELVDSVLTIPHWSPDLVISFNGYNEIWFGESHGRYVGMPLIENQSSMAAPAAALARYSHLASVLLASRKIQIPSEELDEEREPRFFSELQMTATVLRSRGIPYVYSFCPNVFDLAKPEGLDSEIVARRGPDICTAVGESRTMAAVATARREETRRIMLQEDQVYYDITVALNAPSKQAIFMDECHLSSQGTKKVADDLVRRIPSWISSDKSTDSSEGGR
jgi:hypothetical protein